MKGKVDSRQLTEDELLTRLLSNRSNRNRWESIARLRSRPSKALFLKCVDLTKSKKLRNRILGVDILAQLGVTPRPFLKQTIKLYFKLLGRESNSEMLMSLLYAIGHNNERLSRAQVITICSLADAENNLVKRGLVSALLGVDNLNAIEALIKLSTDRSSHIRNWATFGIGTQIERNNKSIRAALWNRASDKHRETKLEAIVGLAKRKDPRVMKVILKELSDGECGPLLLEAVLETGGKHFLPLLRRRLKTIKSDKGISPEWLTDLKRCIYNLQHGKRKAA